MSSQAQLRYFVDSLGLTDNPSIYYARALDGVHPREIVAADRAMKGLLLERQMTLVNPYDLGDADVSFDSDVLTQRNERLLRKSSALIADLSRVEHSYVQVWFEIAEANRSSIPVSVAIGSTDLDCHYYLHRKCDFIGRHLNEAIEFIFRCHTRSGLFVQLEETNAYYDEIAAEYQESVSEVCRWRDPSSVVHADERQFLIDALRETCVGQSVLEIGCGDGRWTRHIVDVAARVCCVDRSNNMLTQAARNAVGGQVRPRLISGDILVDDDIAVSSHTVIVCYFILGIWPTIVQKRFLERLLRQCGPDAKIAFAVSSERSRSEAIGLGTRRLEHRQARRDCVVYKETFSSDALLSLLRECGYEIVSHRSELKYFAYCVARPIRASAA